MKRQDGGIEVERGQRTFQACCRRCVQAAVGRRGPATSPGPGCRSGRAVAAARPARPRSAARVWPPARPRSARSRRAARSGPPQHGRAGRSPRRHPRRRRFAPVRGPVGATAGRPESPPAPAACVRRGAARSTRLLRATRPSCPGLSRTVQQSPASCAGRAPPGHRTGASPAPCRAAARRAAVAVARGSAVVRARGGRRQAAWRCAPACRRPSTGRAPRPAHGRSWPARAGFRSRASRAGVASRSRPSSTGICRSISTRS